MAWQARELEAMQCGIHGQKTLSLMGVRANSCPCELESPHAGKIVCNYENHGDNSIDFDRVEFASTRSPPLLNPSPSSSSDHDAEAAPKRIYLLEDHPTMRSGIKHLLEEDGACCINGESAQAAEALSVPSARTDHCRFGPGGAKRVGFSKTFRFRKELSVLVYSMHEEKYYAERVLTSEAGDT